LLTVAHVAWVPQLGLSYYLAADGISLTLVLLTGDRGDGGNFVFVEYRAAHAGVFCALSGADRRACTECFSASICFLLFVFYEIAIIPKYFLSRFGDRCRTMPRAETRGRSANTRR